MPVGLHCDWAGVVSSVLSLQSLSFNRVVVLLGLWNNQSHSCLCLYVAVTVNCVIIGCKQSPPRVSSNDSTIAWGQVTQCILHYEMKISSVDNFMMTVNLVPYHYYLKPCYIRLMKHNFSLDTGQPAWWWECNLNFNQVLFIPKYQLMKLIQYCSYTNE